MNEKINILNIELYQTSAKAAMQKVVQYMESDSINTVEIITMDMLLKGKDMPGWKEAVESLNLVLPGETEILEAAGVREKTLLRDTAGQVFLKMFLRYIQRNKKRVFLVAQSETELLEMESAIREHDRKLILAGRGVLPPDGAGIEQVINAVNGAETDCIFSLLPSPEQELLIQRNSALLNARVWFGCIHRFLHLCACCKFLLQHRAFIIPCILKCRSKRLSFCIQNAKVNSGNSF